MGNSPLHAVKPTTHTIRTPRSNIQLPQAHPTPNKIPRGPTAHNPTPTGEAGSQLILPRLLLLPTTAPDQSAEPRRARDSNAGRRGVRLAVDLDLGLTRAPLVLRDPGEGVGDVLAAAAPRLLCCDGGPSVSAGYSKDPHQVRLMGAKLTAFGTCGSKTHLVRLVRVYYKWSRVVICAVDRSKLSVLQSLGAVRKKRVVGADNVWWSMQRG